MTAASETRSDNTVTLATHSTFWVSALAVVATARYLYERPAPLSTDSQMTVGTAVSVRHATRS